MAGGKETPRQKMIGMMYLVLTALLALNVSKSVLDAFVAIEENIQRGNITQFERGDAARKDLVQEMNTTLDDEAGKAKKIKIKQYLDLIAKIDKETGSMIKFIDDIKMKILEKSGENVKDFGNKKLDKIIWIKYNSKKPLLPIRMNLQAVEAKDQFDVPMHEIIGSEIKTLDPTKDGSKLWKKFNAYRKFIVETTGSYKEGDNAKWIVKVKDINTFIDNTDLTKQINKMFSAPGNKVNKEDLAALSSIYEELTKQELNLHGEQENIHWMSKTFDHSPLVGAIASLSSLENDILAARAKAVNLLKSKVTTGEYSFNKIQELVSGPGVATAGEPIELKVTMAAYDSDNNPVVTGPGSITIENGIGTVKTTAANNGEMNLSGTVTIYNKAGVPKQRPWTWKVQIVQPNGSIALPELSIMYTGWQNKVVPVAAGVVSSSISVAGGSATPASWSDANGNYKGYYVNVAQGTKQVSITLSGKDKDGKSRSFGTFRYKVKPFPNAQVSGSTISKSTGFIANVSLGADSPFTGLAFNVIGGTIDDVPFSGKAIPGSAVSKVRVGKKVAIEIFYTRNGVRSAVPAQGILKVTN